MGVIYTRTGQVTVFGANIGRTHITEHVVGIHIVPVRVSHAVPSRGRPARRARLSRPMTVRARRDCCVAVAALRCVNIGFQ